MWLWLYQKLRRPLVAHIAAAVGGHRGTLILEDRRSLFSPRCCQMKHEGNLRWSRKRERQQLPPERRGGKDKVQHGNVGLSGPAVAFSMYVLAHATIVVHIPAWGRSF